MIYDILDTRHMQPRLDKTKYVMLAHTVVSTHYQLSASRALHNIHTKLRISASNRARTVDCL